MSIEKLKPMKPKKGDTVENLLQRLLVLDEHFDATIDVLEAHDWGGSGCYGYLGDIQDELKAAQDELSKFPDTMPKIDSLIDKAKYDFFMLNFSKIPLESIEWVVKTVTENKIPV